MIIIKIKVLSLNNNFDNIHELPHCMLGTVLKKEHAGIFQTAELHSPTHSDFSILVENFYFTWSPRV